MGEMNKLEVLLEDITVHDPCDRPYNAECWPDGWWAVSTPRESIVAYFLKEVDAFRFRLDLINRILNP